LTRGSPYYTPEGTPDKMRGDGTRRTPRGAARGAGLALALGLALLATCAPPAAAQGGPPGDGDADGGVTVAAAAAAKAPPRGAPAAQDCALPGWVFLPGVQQATWRGILNCEPEADPHAACQARPDCLAFTSTGWLLGAPAAAECTAGRRRAGLRRALLGTDAQPPAGAPRVAEPAAPGGAAEGADAKGPAPREGPFKGVGGYAWTWKWGWAPLECPPGVRALRPRSANATAPRGGAAAPPAACCGTYVANDAGPAPAFELRCRADVAGRPPHDNYFAGYSPDHLCRCPAMDKTNGFRSAAEYHSECWRQLGFCASTRYSPCRLAAPSHAVLRAAARACEAGGKSLIQACGVVKARAPGAGKAAKALTCSPGRCQDACSLCG
jgi:hypothetical protein